MRYPTWDQLHAQKVRDDERSIDRALRGEGRPQRQRRVTHEPRPQASPCLGGGGAGGGAFCFVSLLPDPEDFTPSREALLRRLARDAE